MSGDSEQQATVDGNDPTKPSGSVENPAGETKQPSEDDSEALLKEEDMGDVDINNLVSEEHPPQT